MDSHADEIRDWDQRSRVVFQARAAAPSGNGEVWQKRRESDRNGAAPPLADVVAGVEGDACLVSESMGVKGEVDVVARLALELGRPLKQRFLKQRFLDGVPGGMRPGRGGGSGSGLGRSGRARGAQGEYGRRTGGECRGSDDKWVPNAGAGAGAGAGAEHCSLQRKSGRPLDAAPPRLIP
ncbi:hypothetical protein ACWD6P_07740 [Streptomyces sp. NPDC002446]